MTKPTTTPRINTEAWEKAKLMAIELSKKEGRVVSANEATRRSIELASRNFETMLADAEAKRRNRIR